MEKTKKIYTSLLPYKVHILLASGLFFVIIIVCTFFYDIGLNSKFFIKRDFTRAFLLRQTGNCFGFIEYVNFDKDEMKRRCDTEKNRTDYRIDPIKRFVIKGITVNRYRAFLLVEIQRGNKTNELNYEMRRNNGKWFLNQYSK